MTNKTFKEEAVMQCTNHKHFHALCIECEKNKAIIQSLDLYKQKILEALPNGEEHMPDDSIEDYHYINGRNFCLSEVKQIIEGI